MLLLARAPGHHHDDAIDHATAAVAADCRGSATGTLAVVTVSRLCDRLPLADSGSGNQGTATTGTRLTGRAAATVT